MRWSLDQVAAATGGRALGRAEVRRVSIDSRHASPGSLFVALRGEAHDGHGFIAAAIESGAVAVLAEMGRLPAGVAGVEVADTLAALGSLGVLRRSELAAKTVAITGSSGKTTTKDLVAAALGSSTHAAPRSYNNEIGVPLTVLSCPEDAGALVIEVGSRGPGHISALGPMIRPDVSVITNVGPAHLEMFGDVSAVRKAKAELLQLLGPDGVSIVPHGDEELLAAAPGPVVTFGAEAAADFAVSEVTLDERARAGFRLSHAGDERLVSLGVSGLHQPLNAAAALAVAFAMGMDLDLAVERLHDVALSPWRMDVTAQEVAGGEVLFVNDAYNANPDSMRSALHTVAAMPGRHIAVLGMMHELGESSAGHHEDAGRLATDLGFEVIVVGEDPGIARGAGECRSVGTLEAAASQLSHMLRPGDVVLVKASRAAGLESLVDLLSEVTA